MACINLITTVILQVKVNRSFSDILVLCTSDRLAAVSTSLMLLKPGIVTAISWDNTYRNAVLTCSSVVSPSNLLSSGSLKLVKAKVDRQVTILGFCRKRFHSYDTYIIFS